MTKLVKYILKKRKAIIATASIIFLSFLVGAHFHKDELWPFGKGYYAVIKDIKKYGFNFKDIKKAEAEQRAKAEKAEAERKAEAVRKAEAERKAGGYITRTSTTYLNITEPIKKNKYNHIAILNETKTTINFLAATQRKLFLVNLNLQTKKIDETLIYDETLKNNEITRINDVLVTEDKRIFISYSSKDHRRYVSHNVSEILYDKNSNSKQYKLKKVYRGNYIAPPYGLHQAGGKMIEYSKNEIMLATGDYQNGFLLDDTKHKLGKTILINLKNLSTKIYSKGHRNPQGLFYSLSYKKIFETEHGPEGGDEINFIQYGKDYGWPDDTYGTIYLEGEKSRYGNDPSRELWSNVGGANFGNHDNSEKPIFAFIPSIGIKAISQLPPNQYEFPKWKDNFIICSSLGLYRAEITNSNEPRVIFVEKFGEYKSFGNIIKKDVLQGCRDLAITSAGLIIDNNFRLIKNKI